MTKVNHSAHTEAPKLMGNEGQTTTEQTPPTEQSAAHQLPPEMAAESAVAEDYVERLRASRAGEAEAPANGEGEPEDGEAETAGEVEEEEGDTDGAADDEGEDDGDADQDQDAAADAAADEAQQTHPDEQAAPSRKKARKDLETRLNAEVSKNTTLENERQRLAAENAELQAKLAASATAAKVAADAVAAINERLESERAKDPEPSEDQIGEEGGPANMDEFVRLHTKWAARDALREERANQARMEAEATAKATADTAEKNRRAYIEDRKARDVETLTALTRFKATPEGKDFDAVLAASAAVMTDAMNEAITYLPVEERGPMFKALALDPAESKRIAELPTFTAQHAAIFNMARRLATAKAGSAPNGSGPETRPRVPSVRPHTGRASASVSIGQETDPDKAVDRLRAQRQRQAAVARGGARARFR